MRSADLDPPLRVSRVLDLGGPLVWVDLSTRSGGHAGQVAVSPDDLPDLVRLLGLREPPETFNGQPCPPPPLQDPLSP